MIPVQSYRPGSQVLFCEGAIYCAFQAKNATICATQDATIDHPYLRRAAPMSAVKPHFFYICEFCKYRRTMVLLQHQRTLAVPFLQARYNNVPQ